MKEVSSLTPYIIRGFYDWSLDNDLTAYISVAVNDQVEVPRNFVQDGMITLNIGPEACDRLQIENDYVSFHARFGGKEEAIRIPVGRISAIYVRETGFGIPFEVKEEAEAPRRGFVKVDVN